MEEDSEKSRTRAPAVALCGREQTTLVASRYGEEAKERAFFLMCAALYCSALHSMSALLDSTERREEVHIASNRLQKKRSESESASELRNIVLDECASETREWA